MSRNKDRRLIAPIASPRLFGENYEGNKGKQSKPPASEKQSVARAPRIVNGGRFSRKPRSQIRNLVNPRHEAWAHTNSSMFTFEPRELEEYQLPRKAFRPGRSLRQVSNQTEIMPEPPSPRVGYMRQPLSPTRLSGDKTVKNMGGEDWGYGEALLSKLKT